ncbi:unnamed protein product [Protopolystoma xenopodis]|uniref:E3 ubiquitin-protein ligase n=1 Tax=Protopolystoma xenopodis TaxID=117903 RepID=A0A448X8M3_9PLAT|nr:unnamed protein product [Protopolystoma xenopodis]
MDSTRVYHECCICLQECVYPVQLPCNHVFCFLCIKGCALHKRKCPMCRTRFAVDFFTDPKVIGPIIDDPSVEIIKSK